MRNAAAPLAADTQPHRRVGLDVADVIGMVAMFGDHPVLLAHQLSADCGATRLPRLAPGGLQHGHWQLPADRVDHEPLDAMNELPFEISGTGHLPDSAASAPVS